MKKRIRKPPTHCARCGQKTLRIYSRVYCKDCNTITTKIRQRSFKNACVDYKGGPTCADCGETFDKDHYGCLCLVTKQGYGSFPFKTCSPSLKPEVRRALDAVDLLCRNCDKARRYGIKTKNANKEFGVAYLGGKCSQCGYNGSVAALEFHHESMRKGLGKTIEIARIKGKNDEALINELDKCKLICSNCHQRTHDDESRARWDKIDLNLLSG